MAYLTKLKFNIADLAAVPKFSRKILLAVDEEVLREIYRRHLSRHNFEVDSLAFGQPQALAERLDSADLLVIDFQSSEADGRLEFLQALARDFPELPVVMIGQALNGKILEKAMSFGVVSFLNRQFSRPEDLVGIIRTVLQP